MSKKEDQKKKGNAPDKTTAPETSIPVGSMPINVMAQYIRDISFENPNAPESLRGGQSAPEMDINIGMDARSIENPDIPNLYEVALNVQARATRGEDIVFLIEIIYGVTLTIGEAVPEENHHPLLLIEIPRLAFPFVREIISTLTAQGGFPPLLLNPVDFHALYMKRFEKEIKEAKEELETKLKS